MKKGLQFLIFLLAFQVEVRVRASGGVLQQPPTCLKTQETCAIQVTHESFHLIDENLKIHAREGATLMRLSENQWRFVKGAVWIEKGPHLEIETLYGSIRASQGQYWLIEQGDQVLVRNMNADLKVTLRDGKKLEVPEGFEFWIAGLNSKGKSEFGMVQPVDMKKHLPLWNSLYRGTKDAFINEVTQLRESWGDLAEKSSSLYKKVAERQIASAEEKQRDIVKNREMKAAKRRQLQEMYRQRVFER